MEGAGTANPDAAATSARAPIVWMIFFKWYLPLMIEAGATPGGRPMRRQPKRFHASEHSPPEPTDAEARPGPPQYVMGVMGNDGGQALRHGC
jgi:hypothetical protein